MSERKSEYQVRKEKLEQLRTIGIIPYAAQYDKTHMINQVLEMEQTKKSMRDSQDIVTDPILEVSIAGRVMLSRTHGALTFVHLQDESGLVQVMLHRDNCAIVDQSGIPQKKFGDTSAYKVFEKLVDV